jgi:hypothetical protein
MTTRIGLIFRRSFHRACAASWQRQLDALRGRPAATPEFVARWEAKIAREEEKADAIRIDR